MGEVFDDAWLASRVPEIVASFTEAGGKKMSDVRRQLELDSGRSFDGVEQRARVKELVVRASEELAAEAEGRAGSEGGESDGESEEPAPARRKQAAKENARKAPVAERHKAAGVAGGGGALWESAPAALLAKITAARGMLKRAGLGAKLATIKGVRTMPPPDVLSRLHGLLAAAGLPAKPSRQELAEFKAKRELERELDGIDTSNVLGDRRRRREPEDEHEVRLFAPRPPAGRAPRRAVSPSPESSRRVGGEGAAAEPALAPDGAGNCDSADAGGGEAPAGSDPKRRRLRAVAPSESDSESESASAGEA